MKKANGNEVKRVPVPLVFSPSFTTTSTSASRSKHFVSPPSPSNYKNIPGKVLAAAKLNSPSSNTTNILPSSSDSNISLNSEVSSSKSYGSASASSSMVKISRTVSSTTPGEIAPPQPSNKHPVYTPKQPTASRKATTAPRTPALGSRATALGYKKTPASSGSCGKGKSCALPLPDSKEFNKNYDQDLKLKPIDVLRLLAMIKTKDAVILSEDHEVCLTELIEKDSKFIKKAACSLNLMGAFNGKDRKESNSSKSPMSVVLQQMEQMMISDETENTSQQQDELENDDNDKSSGYKLLMNQLQEKTDDFISSYAQRALSLHMMDRNQLLDPNVAHSAELSLIRFHDSLGKLVTNSTESKGIRQNLNYKGEGIPCAFESRLTILNSIQAFDEIAYRKKKLHDTPQISKLLFTENDVHEQTVNLKNGLDQLEHAVENYSLQNEKMVTLLKKGQNIT